MKRLIALVLVAILIVLTYNTITRNRRFSPPSDYDYALADSIDIYYYNPTVVREYIQTAQAVGQLARNAWFEHRVDVRHNGDLSPEETQLVKSYEIALTSAQHLEMRLRQSYRWKQEGFNNADIQRIEEEGVSPKWLHLERDFGSLTNLRWDIGYAGDHIRLVQEQLVATGYEIPVDGRMGEQTVEAIRQVQRNHGLLPSGVPSFQTLEAIFSK